MAEEGRGVVTKYVATGKPPSSHHLSFYNVENNKISLGGKELFLCNLKIFPRPKMELGGSTQIVLF